MPPVVRRPAVVLTLTALAGLLAACGSSGHHTAATVGHGAHTTRNGSSSGAVKPMTKAQAIAFAQAVNLTAADLPGFKATSKHEHEHATATEKRLEHELLRCTGGALISRGGVAEVSSKNFKLEHNALELNVNSEVSVAQTPAAAAKELAAIRSNRVRGCVSHYLNLLLKNQLLKNQKSPAIADSISISISRGTPPAPGTTGSFGWQITATITAHATKLPFFYIDILGFVYGPAEVSLFSSGALKPFPAAIQEHLYRLLLQRAKAQLRGAPGKSHPGPHAPLRTSA
jgi:hypothetical protein